VPRRFHAAVIAAKAWMQFADGAAGPKKPDSRLRGE
jgi:hypothetical protein